MNKHADVGSVGRAHDRTGMSQTTLNRFYSDYRKWKSWEGEGTGEDLSDVFSAEMRRAKVRAGARILEIGFGPGAFLDWCRDKGFSIVGIEIDPELTEASRRRGHEVHCGDVIELLHDRSGCFDLIVLFDVLEHVAWDDLCDLFDCMSRLLAEDGKILARFPNGASPFGRAYQYGDATHLTVLSGPRAEQLARLFGMQVLSAHNAARAARSGEGLKANRLVRKLVYVVRDMVQLAIGLIYFGRNIPMDPNMTVVVGKRRDRDDVSL